jgi:hypothetical protein
MENKAKIHQNLVNTEYVPKDLPPTIDQPPPVASYENLESFSPSLDKHSVSIPDNKPIIEQPHKPPVVQPNKTQEEVLHTKPSFKDKLQLLLSDEESQKSSESPSPELKNSLDNDVEDRRSELSDSSNLSQRLRELLGDDSTQAATLAANIPQTPMISHEKYSRHRDRHGHTVTPRGAPEPEVLLSNDTQYIPQVSQTHVAVPSLAELEEKGGYVPRAEMSDLNQPNRLEQDEDAKRELLFKFSLLKKSYPAAEVPEYTIHTDLYTMEKSYSDCVRRLSLDSSVESYKTYLVYGFMGVEFILGNFLGFDMQGFTQQQIISMHSYEKLLIELGEKSYVPSGSSWPVELRLLFMIIMNAGFFVVSKMMMKKTGANLMGMINSMNKPVATARKRKMKGPSVDLGEIPEGL